MSQSGSLLFRQGVGQSLTMTVWKSEGSGAEEVPGGAAAGGGDAWEVTSEDADAAGAVGHHGAKKRVRERVSGRRENPADNSLGVGIREGGPEASGVAETPGGDLQGVGGVVDSPRGIDTPGVEELSRWEENSIVTPKGDVVLGADGRGRGGDGNSPATGETEVIRDISSGK